MIKLQFIVFYQCYLQLFTLNFYTKYFSDGAVLQSKHFQSLISLIIDKLKVEHNFLLISHYKCLYDGLGETIKGETTHAN